MINPSVNSPSVYGWHAVHTKPCQEERAVENLAVWGVETLAPWLETRRVFGSRQPLFPSYIFARFDAQRMLQKINLTRGVSYVVTFGGSPAIVADEVIEAIRTRMSKNGLVRIKSQFKPGDKVMIQSGCLRNFLGVFQRELTGNQRVQVLLTSVAFNARVEVHSGELASADGKVWGEKRSA